MYEQLKNLLYTDSAVAGEAAGIAMGLVMLGSGQDNMVQDMLQYARDTQHEKIIRGMSVDSVISLRAGQRNAGLSEEKHL